MLSRLKTTVPPREPRGGTVFLRTQTRLVVVAVAMIEETRKPACAFMSDRVQGVRGKPEGLKDRRSDLGRVHEVIDPAAFADGRSCDKQGHMGVVERPATVLRDLLLSARIDHAVIGLNEDVRSSRGSD